MKEIVAKEIATRIKNGDVIGIGTGSTVDLAIDAIAQRVKAEKLSVMVVPSSRESAARCESAGLVVLTPNSGVSIPWGFDGADEVDEKLRLIKGRGGAMLQEKILARKCNKFVVIIDESKLVSKLGEKTAVPVEVIPEAQALVALELKKLGASEVKLREGSGKHGAVITEGGNIILDAKFDNIEDALESKIKSLTGVVDSGLFTDICAEVLVGGKVGVRTLKR